MCADESRFDSFEEMIRSIAREVSRSADRVSQFDVEELAETIGVDPVRAREWVESAGGWLRARAEEMEQEHTPPMRREAPAQPADDPLRGAAPHPLDAPTDEQGLALAALDSGRWRIEPGSQAIVAEGDARGPDDALGLARELHSRDWIDDDGQLTLTGRHALSRWLDAGPRH